MNMKSLSEDELKDVVGGGLIEIAVGYAMAAAAFIYTMGKDGKSAVSYHEEIVVDAITY